MTLAINAIEKIIIKNKISIPSYLILALEGITTTDEKFLAAKEVHLLLMEENQRAYSLGKENGLKEGERNFENILSSERRRADHAEKEVQRYKKVIEDLQEKILNEKGKSTKIRKEKDEIEKKAKQNYSENLILQTNIKELHDSIANYKKEISAMEDRISRYKVDEEKLSNEFLLIKSEYLNLQEELSTEQLGANELRERIAYLERRCFSDRIIKELCSDVVLDIQVDNIGKEETIKYAHLIFAQDLGITDAWDRLSIKNNDLLVKVINMMKENSVVGDDISILDEVENGIYIKFLILKCLKVLFYKTLEIKEIETSISQGFINNTRN